GINMKGSSEAPPPKRVKSAANKNKGSTAASSAINAEAAGGENQNTEPSHVAGVTAPDEVQPSSSQTV
ncbi:hypothetical protein A2U01_0050643, partial [Trifolium medium]|nr:hypothetical protein [Trifolium medium]